MTQNTNTHSISITVYDITRVPITINLGGTVSEAELRNIIDATLASGFYADLSRLESVRSTPIGWVCRAPDSGAFDPSPKIYLYSTYKGLKNPVCHLYMDNKPYSQPTQIAVFEALTGLTIADLPTHTGRMPKKETDQFEKMAIPVPKGVRLYYRDKGDAPRDEGERRYIPLQLRAIVDPTASDDDSGVEDDDNTPTQGQGNQNAHSPSQGDSTAYEQGYVVNDLRVKGAYTNWKHIENAIKKLLAAKLITPQSTHEEVVLALLARKGADPTHWSCNLENVQEWVGLCSKIPGFDLTDFVGMEILPNYSTGKKALATAKEVYNPAENK